MYPYINVCAHIYSTRMKRTEKSFNSNKILEAEKQKKVTWGILTINVIYTTEISKRLRNWQHCYIWKHI